MQVKLSSQNKDVISHGTVFLYDRNSDLTINFGDKNSFELILTINFKEDFSETQKMKTNQFENHLEITCINFTASGTGLSSPLKIAVLNGKKIYLMFWAYLEGNDGNKKKVRKVDYTLYSER